MRYLTALSTLFLYVTLVTQASPTSIPGIQAWFHAGQLNLENGQKVGTWINEFGADLIQADSSAMPQFIENALNGQPVLRFDGVKTFLTAGNNFNIPPAGNTIFVVAKADKNNSDILSKHVHGWQLNKYLLSFPTIGKFSYMHSNITRSIDINSLYGSYSVRNVLDVGVSEIFYFGKNQSSTQIIAQDSLKSNYHFIVGGRGNQGGGIPPQPNSILQGDIAEIIIFGRPLADEEMNKINLYIFEKYFPDRKGVILGENIKTESLCPITLSADREFASYLWNTGETGKDIIVTESGIYRITATDEAGVFSTDSIKVEFPGETQKEIVHCHGKDLMLSTGLDEEKYSFLWDNGSTEPFIYVNTQNLFTVNLTDGLGCGRNYYFNVTTDSLVDQLYLPTDTSVCKNNSVCPIIVSYIDSNVSYNWNDGLYEYCFRPNISGEYNLVATNSNACIVSKSINITISGEAPVPQINITGACLNSLIKLEAGYSGSIPAISYEWEFSNGQTSSGHIYEGRFNTKDAWAKLYATGADGCIGVKEEVFYVSEAPRQNLLLENTCIGTEYILFSDIIETDNPIESIRWFTGSELLADGNSSAYIFHEEGNKIIESHLKDIHGCIDTTSAAINVFEYLELPSQPLLSYPLNGAKMYGGGFILRWTGNANNTRRYKLIISESADYENSTDIILENTENEYLFQSETNSDFYWKVRAYNLCGKYSESETRHFSTNKLPYEPELWLRADNVTIENSKVSEWKTASSSGLRVVQPDPAKRPTIQENALNGKPAVIFTGTEWLGGGNILDIMPEGYSVFVVGQSLNASGTYYAKSKWTTVSGCHGLYYESNNLRLLYHDSGRKLNNISTRTNDFELLSLVYADSAKNKKNGAGILSFPLEPGFNMITNYDFLIGAYNNNNGTVPQGHFLNGFIAELIIYQKALSKKEVLEVEAYLMAKYFPDMEEKPVDLGPDIIISYGFKDTVISIYGNYNKYEWSNGSDSSSARIDKTGRYSVTVTDKYGRKSSDDIFVQFPSVKIDDIILCNGDIAELALPFKPDGYTFLWTSGSTADTLKVSQAGSWTVTVTDSLGYSNISPTVNVVIDYFPDRLLLPNDTVICAGNFIAPKAIPSELNSYEWNNGLNDFSNRIFTSGQYSFSAVNINNCKASAVSDITIDGIAPAVKIVSDTVCTGSFSNIKDITAHSSSIVERKWTIGGDNLASGDAEISYKAEKAGAATIRLTLTDELGCSGYAEAKLFVSEIPEPSFEFIRGNFACTNTSLHLRNTSIYINDSITVYKWINSGNEYLGFEPEIIQADTGSFELVLETENIFGCKAEYTLEYSVYSPQPRPLSPHVISPYHNAVLADSLVHFSWTNIKNTQALYLEISADSAFGNIIKSLPLSSAINEFSLRLNYSSSYWWRIKAFNSCKDSVVSPHNYFQIYKPSLLSGLNLWLSADKGVEADSLGQVSKWRDMSGNNKHAIQSIETSRPKLIENALNGLPVLRFDGTNDFLIGQNLYAQENNISIFVVHRYNGGRSNAAQYIFNQAGNTGNKYSLNALANTDFRTVFDVEPPAGGTVGSIGYGSSFYRLSSVKSSRGNTSLFTNGELNTSANSETYNGIETEFIIGNRYSSSPSGWLAGDIAEIIIYGRALSDIEHKLVEEYLLSKYRTAPLNLGPDIEITYGLCDTLIGSEHSYQAYLWSVGSNAASISALWPGQYSLTVTDGFGMQSSDSISVFRNFNKLSDTVLCAGQNMLLDFSGSDAYSYTWNNGSNSGSLLANREGIYFVTASDTLGCSIIHPEIKVLYDSTEYKIHFPSDNISACVSEIIEIAGIETSGTNFLWNNGSTAKFINVESSGQISVTVTSPNGCVGSAEAFLEVRGEPMASAFDSDTACSGTPTKLISVSQPEAEYKSATWLLDGNIIGQGTELGYIFPGSGTFNITLIDSTANNCASTVQASVQVLPSPTASFGTEKLCANEDIILKNTSLSNNNEAISSSSWFANNEFLGNYTHQTFNPGNSSSANISLSVSNSLGCSDSISMVLPVVQTAVHPLAAVLASPANEAVYADSTINFNWEKSINTYRYVLEISGSKHFENIIRINSFETSLSHRLDSAGKYYWRIKSFSYCNDSVVSATYSFEVLGQNLTAGLALWLNASSGITYGDNNAVASWKCLYSPYTVSQNTVANRPVLSPDSLFGHPLIRFDGTNDFLSGASLGINSGKYSIFSVHRYNANKASALNVLFNQAGSTGSNAIIYASPNSDNTQHFNTFSPEREPMGNIPLGTKHFSLTTVVSSGAEIKMFNNREPNGMFGPARITPSEGQFFLGTMGTSATVFNGDLAELIVFRRDLSPEEIKLIEDYLLTKYSPKLDLGPDIDYSICKTQLDAGNYFSSYEWSNGKTTSEIDIEETGSISIKATDYFGIIQKDTININRPMLLNLSNNFICLGDSLQWHSGFDDRYSINWSNGHSEHLLNIVSPATYSFTVYDSLGCSLESEIINVEVDSFPILPSLVARENACRGELIYVDMPAQPGIKFSWSNGGTSSTAILDETGLYSVRVTNINNCFADLQQYISVDGISPQVRLQHGPICEGTSSDLTALFDIPPTDSITSVIWRMRDSADKTGISINIQPKDTNKIFVQIIADTKLGCRGISLDTIAPMQNPIPSIISIFGDSLCLGYNHTFTANSANEASYSWKLNNSDIGSGSPFSYVFENTGNQIIHLEANYPNGCTRSVSRSFYVIENNPVPAEFSLIYPAENLKISIEKQEKFSWSISDNAEKYRIEVSETSDFAQIIFAKDVFSVNTSKPSLPLGDYYWRIAAVGKCGDETISQSRKVSFVNNLVQAEIQAWFDAGQLNLRDGQKAGLWANEFGANLMQSDSSAMPVFIENALNGHPVLRFDGVKTFLTAGNNFNIPSAGNTIFVVAKADRNNSDILSKHVHGWQLNKYLLSFPTIGKFSYMHSNSTRTIDANSTYGSYSVRNALDLGVSEIFYFGKKETSTDIPIGDNLISTHHFIVGGRGNQGGGPPPQPNSILQGDIAEIIIFGRPLADEEMNKINLYIFEKYFPDRKGVSLGEDIVAESLCPITLTADREFAAYLWNTGHKGKSIIVSEPGIYSITATDEAGVVSVDSVSVEFPWNSNKEFFLCLGSELILDTNLDEYRHSFEWNTGQNSKRIAVDSAGLFTVSVTDSWGCSKNMYFNIKIDSFPILPSLVAREYACKGELIYVDFPAQSGIKFSWNNGGVSSTSIIDETGVYSVRITNKNNCFADLQQYITVDGTAPTISIEHGPICEGTATELIAVFNIPSTDSITSVLWRLDDSTDIKEVSISINPVDTQKIFVQIIAETKLGCRGISLDTIVPMRNPIPIITSTFGDSLCLGQNHNFTANSENVASYKWRFNSSEVGLGSTFDYAFQNAGNQTFQLEANYLNKCIRSASKSFYIIDYENILSDFLLVYPSNNEIVNIDNRQHFKWSSYENIDKYRLELSNDSIFSEIVFTNETKSSFIQRPNVPFEDYYWRVLAIGKCGEELYSETRKVSFVNNFANLDIQAWFDAGQINKANGQKVGTWTNKFGTDLFQSDSSAMPLFVENALNGQPVLRFDGVKTFLTAGNNFNIPSVGNTIFVVAKADKNNSDILSKHVHGWQLNKYLLSFPTIGKFSYMHSNITRSIDINSLYGSYSVRNALDVGVSEIFYFGKNQSSTQIIAQDSLKSNYHFIVGGRGNQGGGPPPQPNSILQGDIAEIIIFGRPLADEEMNKINLYIFEKYFPDRKGVSLGGDITTELLCPVSLSADREFASYRWNTGQTERSILVTEPGTYRITATDEAGVVSTDSVKVEFPGKSYNELVHCLGTDLILSTGLDDTKYSFLWENGDTGPQIKVNTEGLYIANLSDSTGCKRNYYFNVATDSLIEQVYLPADTSLCANNILCAELSNSAYYPLDFNWAGGHAEQCIAITEAGKINLTVASSNKCTAVFEVNINITGTASALSISYDKLCAGNAAKFRYSGEGEAVFVSQEWDFGNSLKSALAEPEITYNDSKSYTIKLRALDNAGCTSTLSNVIEVNALPVLKASIGESCLGLNSSVNFSPTDTYKSLKWEMGDASTYNSNISAHTYSQAGTYLAKLSVTDTNNCADSINVQAIVHESLSPVSEPQLIFPAHKQRVYSDSISFSWHSSDAAYWSIDVYADAAKSAKLAGISNISTPEFIFAAPYIDSVYWQVSAYNACADATQSTLRSAAIFHPLALPGAQLWLVADSVKLADSSAVPQWTNIVNKNLSLKQPLNDMQPLVIKNQLNGHSVLRFDGINDYLDGGDIMDMGAAGQTVFVVGKNTGAEGTYYAKSLYANAQQRHALFSTETALTYLYQDVTGRNINATKQDYNYALLSAKADIPNSIASLYSNGRRLGQAAIQSGFSMNSTYNFLVGAYNNDKGTVPPQGWFLTGDIAEIIFYSRALSSNEQRDVELYLRQKYFPEQVLPSVNLGPDIAAEYGFCPIEISAGQFASYAWSNGAATESIVAYSPGVYSVTVTDIYGVASADSITVTYPRNLQLKDTALCYDGVLQLNAGFGAGYKYNWNTGDTLETILINKTGSYSATIYDTLGCSYQLGPISVDIDFFSQQASLGSNRALCAGNRIGLHSGMQEGISYLWNGTETGSEIQVSQTGWHLLEATNRRGCIFRDSVYITVDGFAPYVAFRTEGRCTGDTILLISEIAATDGHISAAQWQVAGQFYESDTVKLVLSQGGKLPAKLYAQQSNGCADSAAAVLDIKLSPAPGILPLQTCTGQETLFRVTGIDISQPGNTYQWQRADTVINGYQARLISSLPGSFNLSLIVRDAFGCSGQIDEDINVKTMPLADFTHTPACKGISSAFFNTTAAQANNPRLSSSWSIDGLFVTSADDFEYKFDTEGLFEVKLEMSFVNGCKSEKEQILRVTERPKIYLKNAEACAGDSILLHIDSISPAGLNYSYSWRIEGNRLINADTAAAIFNDAGTYPYVVSAQSEYGCGAQQADTITIFPKPIAGIAYSSKAYPQPFDLLLESSSVGADSLIWFIEGQSYASGASMSLRIADTLSRIAELVAVSDNMCKDTASEYLKFTDLNAGLKLTGIIAYKEAGYVRIVMSLHNSGNYEFGELSVFAQIDNSMDIKEKWNGEFPGGEYLYYQLSTEFAQHAKPVTKICAYAAASGPTGNLHITDTLCVSPADGFANLPLYPNPVYRLLHLDYAMPDKGNAKFSIINEKGQPTSQWETEAKKGLNIEQIDVGHLPGGIYFLQVETSYGVNIFGFTKL
jgi:hypothetical protein